MITLQSKGFVSRRGGYVYDQWDSDTKKSKTGFVYKCDAASPENKALAEEARKVELTKLRVGTSKKHADMNLMELYEDWKTLRIGTSSGTMKYYGACIASFTSYVHGKPISQLDGLHLERFLAGLKVGASQKRKYAKSISAVVNYFAKKVKGFTNPFLGITMPNPVSRDESCMLTDDELTLFAHANDKTFADLVLCIAYTGMRPGEACTLKGSMVDLTSGTITLEAHKTMKTGGSPYRAIMGQIKGMLTARKEVFGDGYLFQHSPGEAYSADTFGKAFRNFREDRKVNRKRIPHGLRHRFCHECLKVGLTEAQCAELLGHADSEMVRQVYGHKKLLFQNTASHAAKLFASMAG